MSSHATAVSVTSWCSTCGGDRVFEQPECVDGHEGDCLDHACTQCGEAITFGFYLAETARSQRPTGPASHVA